MLNSESYFAEFNRWSSTGLWRLASSIYQHRKSAAWLVAALIAVFAGFVCMTIRVHDSFLDVTQLQLLVCALMILATTNLLMAFRVRSGERHARRHRRARPAGALCVPSMFGS